MSTTDRTRVFGDRLAALTAATLVTSVLLVASIARAQPTGDAGTPSPPPSTPPSPPPSPPPSTPPSDEPVTDPPPPAIDEPDEPIEHDDFRHRWVALGLTVGIYVPSIVNEMGPQVNVGLDAALLLPFIERRLGVMFQVGWSPPGASGSSTDARIGETGGPWTYEMTTQELFFGLGPVFRFLPPGSTLVPYLGVLGRLYLLETSVEGTGGGQSFGENTEHSTQAGVVFLAGGELRLGPGSALLEISFGISDLPHAITGETSTGALSVALGYRLFL